MIAAWYLWGVWDTSAAFLADERPRALFTTPEEARDWVDASLRRNGCVVHEIRVGWLGSKDE